MNYSRWIKPTEKGYLKLTKANLTPKEKVAMIVFYKYICRGYEKKVRDGKYLIEWDIWQNGFIEVRELEVSKELWDEL